MRIAISTLVSVTLEIDSMELWIDTVNSDQNWYSELDKDWTGWGLCT